MQWELILTGLTALLAGIPFYKTFRPAVPQRLSLCAADDSDMKIVGSLHPSPRKWEPAACEAERYAKAKEDGSIDKAQQLGKALSKMINNLDFGGLNGIDTEDSNVLVHLFLLCIFSVDHALDECLLSSLLAQVAQNSLIENLDSKAVYKDIRVNGAYSMYRLATRSTDIPSDVGKAFAELCLRENDEAYTAAGRTLYSRIRENTAEIVKELRFPDTRS